MGSPATSTSTSRCILLQQHRICLKPNLRYIQHQYTIQHTVVSLQLLILQGRTIIRPSSQYIRLLTLEASEDEQALISCYLKAASLHPELAQTILVDHRVLNVTTNLLLALRKLRAHSLHNSF